MPISMPASSSYFVVGRRQVALNPDFGQHLLRVLDLRAAKLWLETDATGKTARTRSVRREANVPDVSVLRRERQRRGRAAAHTVSAPRGCG